MINNSTDPDSNDNDADATCGNNELNKIIKYLDLYLLFMSRCFVTYDLVKAFVLHIRHKILI